MHGTAWQDSYTEGANMVRLIPKIIEAGAGWQPHAEEVPAVLVTPETVNAFVEAHPEAIGK